MACTNKQYQKSVQTAYNNATQAFVATGTPIAVLGNLVTNNGCSIDTGTSGFTINKSGLYRISYDVTYTPAGAGVAVIQLYNNTVAYPCATAQQTVASGSVYTDHIETIVNIPACCSVTPVITAQISGVAGAVNHVCASVTKLA